MMLRVDELFEHSISCEPTSYYCKSEEAERALVDYREEVWTIARSLFEVPEAFEGLQSPRYEDGYVPVHFPDVF